jgi:integrase/recombinase XerD
VPQQMRPSAYHLRQSDIRKLILAANNFRDRTLIKALWWLGLRRHELVALGIRDIDFERKRVTVRAGKGNKTRVVPIIDDEFLSDLKHLIGPRTVGPLFCANGHQAMSLRLVNHIVQRVGENAGVTNPNPGRVHLNPHIFRHSIARFLKSKGFSAEWIQNFLGHQSYQTTTDMYGTISIDEMQEIAERMQAHLIFH